MADASDKRLFPRTPDAFMATYTVRSPFAVYTQLSGRECDALAYDISEGGVALATQFDIPMKAVILLKFNLFNASGPRKFSLESEVRYAEPIPKDNSFRLGILFLKIGKEDKAFIAEYVRTHRSA